MLNLIFKSSILVTRESAIITCTIMYNHKNIYIYVIYMSVQCNVDT